MLAASSHLQHQNMYLKEELANSLWPQSFRRVGIPNENESEHLSGSDPENLAVLPTHWKLSSKILSKMSETESKNVLTACVPGLICGVVGDWKRYLCLPTSRYFWKGHRMKWTVIHSAEKTSTQQMGIPSEISGSFIIYCVSVMTWV